MSEQRISAAQPGSALPPSALTTDDYRQLYEMSTSEDAAIRAQAASLAQKLTPREQQDFGAFQKTQHPQGEIGRVDNQVLGLPPELAAVSAAKVIQAIGTKGLSAAGRAIAGARASGREITPIVKYEIAKTALRGMGVPEWAAGMGAGLITGMTGGKGAAEKGAAAESVGAESAAARDAVVTPTPAAPVESPVAGASPGAARAAAPRARTAAPKAGSIGSQLKAIQKEGGLTAVETDQAFRWLKQGVDPPVIWKRIQDARQLQGTGPFAGLPTAADVAKSVTKRNATGNWDE